ncbi:unnamed protein product [Peronospora farinosa]|uniref:Uncharacterized protein n=1 Tax=Peronospora farinosa TaxID=134698 RepID=A0AAV0UD61_9STRA|nr:unnamed protein product [Peronospora farinosa]
MDPITHTPDANRARVPHSRETSAPNLGPPVSATFPPPVVPDTTTGVEVIVATTSSDVATQAGAVMSPHASAKVAGGMRPVRVASKGEAGVMMVAAGLGVSFAEEEEKGELRPEIMTVPVVLVRASHAGGLAVPLNSD